MKQNNKDIEPFRVIRGAFATNKAHGNNGHFFIPYNSKYLLCIVSDGAGWEHVSFRIVNKKNTRSWIGDYRAMKFVKEMFWEDTECVVQYFPPKKDHINMHDNVLHLWKPTDQELPMPKKVMV